MKVATPETRELGEQRTLSSWSYSGCSRGEVQVMELGLEDKVAVVTGSSKGIGKAIAVELAREGSRVVLAARGENDLEVAAEDVRQTGSAGDVLALAADVTKSDEVERLIEE